MTYTVYAEFDGKPDLEDTFADREAAFKAFYAIMDARPANKLVAVSVNDGFVELASYS